MGMAKERQRSLEEAVIRLHEKNTAYHAYREDDVFTMNGKPVFSVLDFWRFRYAQLYNQHEVIAEYLVNRALGNDKAENVNSWTGYDLSYLGKRVEVKASMYVHPWNRKKVSKVRTFSIAPSSNLYWYGKLDANGQSLARQNDLYVFCLNNNKEIEKADPLLIDYWEFYVVPTFRVNQMCINNGNPNQKKISLGVVRRLAGKAVKWTELKQAVDEVIDQIDKYIEEIDN